jgi:23S rRNA (pseudouridine1915-N3)-methyltransferase
MRLIVIGIGHKMPAWINEGFNEYAKRMPRAMPIQWLGLRPERRGGSISPDRILESEGERILHAVPDGATLIALDEQGEHWNTTQLAGYLKQRGERGAPLAFVIGGADGLAPAVKARAERLLALSSFTLPHGLARVLLAEQLYRAVSLLSNHPYHRE